MNLLSRNLKVVIVKDQLGNAVRLTSNPKYAYVQLRQERIMYNMNTGWTKSVTFTALVNGDTETLKKLNFDNISELEGNIVVIESTTPTNPKNLDKDIKRTGKNGVILCTEDGEPIYRRCMYDPTGLQKDILVEHQKIETEKPVQVETIVKTKEPEVAKEVDQQELEEDPNQLNIFSEESTIEDEVKELLENSDEEEVEESKVDLGSIGNKFVEEEIQEDFVELEDEFTFDIEG
jgi:hypothetical protein